MKPLLNRRQILVLGAATWPLGAQASHRPPALLVIVGGAEDRLKDKIILRRFLELSDGINGKVLILTAASAEPAAAWVAYAQVFGELGARNASHLSIASVDEANSLEVVARILDADGIFITGGDQRRLMERLAGSAAARALHTAFHLRSCCMGGTSAGAAAMSHIMLAEGDTPQLPEKDAAVLGLGLGFVSNAIIDQHFSQRRRLGRLLSALAQQPELLGVGIDEDTALIIERGRGIEIIGKGTVTLIDGRRMATNYHEVGASERLEMLGVRLHVLPAGNRYDSEAAARPNAKPVPASLRDAISFLAEPGPIRG
jgi:cyanophycinase